MLNVPYLRTEGPVNWQDDIVVPLKMIPLYDDMRSRLFKGRYVLLYGPRQYGKTSIARALCEDYDLNASSVVCIHTLSNVSKHYSTSDF